MTVSLRIPWRVTLASLLVWLIGAGLSRAAASPNLILILTDDQAWNGSSVAMHPDYEHSASDYYETPNIERLANAGMRFTNGYSPAPICTPTRRSLQYGVTPARQKGSLFLSPFEPEKQVSVAQMLKRINPRYLAGHFGKWGSQMGIDPADAGYDAGDGPTDNWVGGMELGHPLTTQLFRVNDDPKRSFSLTERANAFMAHAVEQDRPSISRFRTLRCIMIWNA
jgi:arylsulfatase A-like enzyme